jgi:hypothetical protein
VAGDSAVALADVRAALAGCPACFSDYAHFTDAGAARVAGVMAGAVERAARRRRPVPVATVPAAGRQP